MSDITESKREGEREGRREKHRGWVGRRNI